MILIADSGSTKTDWCLIDRDNNKFNYHTEGINPYFQSMEDIIQILRAKLYWEFDANKLSTVHFYGAGCSSESKCEVVRKAFQTLYPRAKVQVDHDMMGAARALCSRQKGMVAILGTGSNSVLFDGENITEDVPSLGYVLGDEGSGAYIGKEILKKFVYRELSAELHEQFLNTYQLNKDDILEHVYRKPLPNRFLASFCRFAGTHIAHSAMQSVVHDAFTEFIKRHISKYSYYRETPLHCCGSVAYNFKEILARVCQEQGVILGKVEQSPVHGLTEFHKRK